MAEITKRDIKLFRVMALGVSNLEMIMSLLPDLFGIKISRYAIEKRLSLLRADGYIISRKYMRLKQHGHKTLYSLTKKAVVVLTSLGHPVERIRYGLPEDIMALHELAITETLHTIAMEASQGLYNFVSTDSTVLKQLRQKWSGDLIPDLHLELSFKDGRKTTVNVEIDMGTILLHKMRNRLRLLSAGDDLVLVLCKVESRIKGLREAYIYKPELVYFVLQEDFNNGGFGNTRLMNINGEAMRLKLH